MANVRNSHYQAEASSKPIPTCPKCGNEASEAKTRYGVRNACCGLWSWDRFPLACAATHEARKDAHVAFDELWISGQMSRTKAYKSLALTMKLAPGDCHIKMMDLATALQVKTAVASIRSRL